jgi:transportin-3
MSASVAKTPLLGFAFDALASEELFDAAVDVICDLIHETQEIDENMPVIELVVPRVIALRPKLTECADDPEKMRGFTRIFTEAGETYRLLLLQHTETFFPIVEAIGECSAYPDLDIVPLTFHFWMRLAQSIGKKPSVSPMFLAAYRSLMTVIIRHLHFPADPESMSHQALDDFRSFRHVMGDTLKDCCFVLGADSCLTATFELVSSALSRHNTQPSSLSWQELEAPLFSMRSMGAEIDPSDNTIIPQIMDAIPSLPQHPRIRYAALLLVARYSPWINYHPEYIQTQLQYISAGFEDNDDEVKAAAGQAMKYICEDCKRVSFLDLSVRAIHEQVVFHQHLGSFLPQLHTFLAVSDSKLVHEDRRAVYEAIAHVISALPMEQAAQSLRTFSADILTRVHSVASNRALASKQELQEVSSRWRWHLSGAC